MSSATKKPQSAARPKAKKPLSPRGRGAVPAPDDEDRLLNLFAANMRLVRLSCKLSQEALGGLCDLDRTYISSLERKQRNVSIRNIQRIADALGVDARLLLDPNLANDPRFAAAIPLVGGSRPVASGTS